MAAFWLMYGHITPTATSTNHNPPLNLSANQNPSLNISTNQSLSLRLSTNQSLSLNTSTNENFSTTPAPSPLTLEPRSLPLTEFFFSLYGVSFGQETLYEYKYLDSLAFQIIASIFHVISTFVTLSIIIGFITAKVTWLKVFLYTFIYKKVIYDKLHAFLFIRK